MEAGCGDGGGGGERCCDKFQIFQIIINVSPEPLKVVKTVNLVLLMWMDAKEDYEGKHFSLGHCMQDGICDQEKIFHVSLLCKQCNLDI